MAQPEIWEEFPEISVYIKKLTSFTDLNSRFLEIFDNNGEILDTASPELALIRKRANSLRMQIQKTMQALLSDSSLEHYLQDKYVTQREDRYVLPVKENAVPFVNGIVQSHSGSKSTVFIEPMSVVPPKCELRLIFQRNRKFIGFSIAYTSAIKTEKERTFTQSENSGLAGFHFACGHLCNTLKAKTPILTFHPLFRLKIGKNLSSLNFKQHRKMTKK